MTIDIWVYIIGGALTILSGVIGFLIWWISRVEDRLDDSLKNHGNDDKEVHDKMWGFMKEQAEQVNKSALEDVKTFATKSDIKDIEAKMMDGHKQINQRLDQLFMAVSKSNGHAGQN